MLTELLFIFPIVSLTYFKIIDWKLSLCCIFTIYWIPKSPILMTLNYLYPQVLTHGSQPKFDNKNEMKQIALTFDDVPYHGTKNLIQIVDLLDEYKMKGTFFVISDFVNNEETKQLLINMVKNGHELGNHGKRDIMHFALTDDSLKEEISSCDKLIRDIYHSANVKIPDQMLYRPGCGAFNQRIIDLAKNSGYSLILGSVYPNDPMVRFSYINYLYLIYHIEHNDIVITHDRAWTPSMLKRLLNYMDSNKFVSVTVETLLTGSK